MAEAKMVKVPPHSKDSEMMVLGCMLTNVNSLNASADMLDDSDFYFTEHKIIFSALKTAFVTDKPADVHLIAEELKRQGKLKAVGGVAYLTTLAQYVGTSAYIEEYATLVKSKALLRRMITAAQEIEKTALEDPEDVSVALDEAQSRFYTISQSANPTNGLEIKDILSGAKAQSQIPYLKELQHRQEEFAKKDPNESKITGIPTHYIDLDKMLNGLGDSNLIILAARPAMGKTALAINMAENVSFRNDIPVGIFSLEMTAEQLLHRIICSQSEVESEKIKTGALDGSEYQRVVGAVGRMQKKTMIIDDTPGLKITDLRARARRMKEAYDIGFLIIDYLQLLSGSGHKSSSENRQNEISEISRMLKNLARELNIPILCLSQLSRKVEERTGHRPMMSDLRESGCLTGDALLIEAKTGKRVSIKSLAERKKQTPIKVKALNPDTLKVEDHVLTKAFCSGKKVVYQMTTKSGKTIKASANHPFFKLNGWTRLDQLKVGDKIGTPRKIKTSTKRAALSREELSLLAHLIGDGCILPNQPYHYTSADPENIKVVQGAAKSLFNINGRIVNQKNWFHLYLPSPIRLSRKVCHPITDWYHKMGIEQSRSYEKRLPQDIFSCNQDDIAYFLKHLWSTDGNISHKQIKGRKPSAAIYYATSSKTLASQVQHLLLRQEIHSSLRKVESKKGYRCMYHVHVEGSHNQKKFLNTIGAIGQRGSICNTLSQNLNQIQPNPNTDIIPKEAWKLFVEEEKEKKMLPWREVQKQLGVSYCGSTLFKSGISRFRMTKLATILESPKLLQLAESDLFWDEIVSIEKLREETVYDATVDGVHNFIANDIVVHNSIEQDSDQVLFLLRREYYDPYDKPGLAELIVAKNRHGAVGVVNLSFRKEIAQFANYSSVSLGEEEDNEEAFAAFSPPQE